MVKLYADGADINEMTEMIKNPLIKGFTTNPTLCRKAGVEDYAGFGKKLCELFPDYPISFEVIADDFPEMERQARLISSWGSDVYVKIPVCRTDGNTSVKTIKRLSDEGIKVNVTAVLSARQVQSVIESLNKEVPAIISIFAGRIADTGRYPRPTVEDAVRDRQTPIHEILWASPRQVMDVYEAESSGADIITITKDILSKLPLKGKGLYWYSMQTVKMFYNDAQAAGYVL